MKIQKQKKHLSEVLGETIIKLQAGPLQRVDELPANTPSSCVFAIYLKSELVHIGQSRSTLKYLRRICLESGTFLPIGLARKSLGKIAKTFQKGPSSLENLMADPRFVAAVADAEVSLKDAKVRLVEIRNAGQRNIIHAVAQAVLMCPPTLPR